MRAARNVLALAAICLAPDRASAAPVTALEYSPDGSVLAAAAGGSVTFLSVDSGKTLRSFACYGGRAVAVAFHRDGDLVAIGTGTPGESGSVRLLDWRAQKWLGALATNRDAVTSVAFSPDGKSLAIASADKSAAVHRIKGGGAELAPAFPLTGHSAAVRAIVFSPDGQTLVTASLDRSIKVWSGADGRLIRSFGQHTDAVQALAFRPVASDRADAPAYCASAGDDRTVRVWQPAIGRMVRIVRRHGGPVLSLVFAPDGRTLFSAGQEGIIRRIDADSDEIVGEWRASDDWIYSLAVSPNGRTLAAGDWAGSVQQWNLDRSQPPAKLSSTRMK